MSEKRVNWLDIAKGLAIIFIVLGHIYTNKIAYTILYSFHLQIFMFVSGYLYKKRNIGEFAKRKFKTVIIPYLFFGILEILYFYIVEARFRDYIPIKESILGLVTGNYDWLGFNVHLWYLPFFFAVCNMYNILENLFGGGKTPRMIFLVLAILGIFIKLPNLPFSINRWELMAYFALGEFVRSKIDLNELFMKKSKNKIICCSLISMLLVVVMNIFNFNKYGLEYIVGTLGILFVMTLSYLMDSKDKILGKIGKCTLIILCIHGPIYRILIKVFSIIVKSSTDAVRQNIICALVITFVDIAICYYVYKFLCKYIPWSVGKGKLRGEKNKM